LFGGVPEEEEGRGGYPVVVWEEFGEGKGEEEVFMPGMEDRTITTVPPPFGIDSTSSSEEKKTESSPYWTEASTNLLFNLLLKQFSEKLDAVRGVTGGVLRDLVYGECVEDDDSDDYEVEDSLEGEDGPNDEDEIDEGTGEVIKKVGGGEVGGKKVTKVSSPGNVNNSLVAQQCKCGTAAVIAASVIASSICIKVKRA